MRKGNSTWVHISLQILVKLEQLCKCGPLQDLDTTNRVYALIAPYRKNMDWTASKTSVATSHVWMYCIQRHHLHHHPFQCGNFNHNKYMCICNISNYAWIHCYKKNKYDKKIYVINNIEMPLPEMVYSI